MQESQNFSTSFLRLTFKHLHFHLPLRGLEFTSEVPVLKLIASKTIKQTGENYQTEHLNRLGKNVQSITIEGNHFIYHGNVATICDATADFLNDR